MLLWLDFPILHVFKKLVWQFFQNIFGQSRSTNHVIPIAWVNVVSEWNKLQQHCYKLTVEQQGYAVQVLIFKKETWFQQIKPLSRFTTFLRPKEINYHKKDICGSSHSTDPNF